MLIIDRFEGEKAVIEANGTTYDIPKALLPKETKEGDIIKITINQQATQKRKAEINNLSDELFD